MLDVYRYGPPELREAVEAWNGAPVEWVEHYVGGVYDVFLVEPETGIVVGTGDGLVPTVPTGRLRNLDELTPYPYQSLVDRAGRTYLTVGGDDTVSRQTIYRTGFDGTVEEIVLDWGDATECLLTRIVAVGPEGHLLTRQRPEEPSPVSIVCLFAPDGSFVLSLPPDPDRRWIGFSDPVQWY